MNHLILHYYLQRKMCSRWFYYISLKVFNITLTTLDIVYPSKCVQIRLELHNESLLQRCQRAISFLQFLAVNPKLFTRNYSTQIILAYHYHHIVYLPPSHCLTKVLPLFHQKQNQSHSLALVLASVNGFLSPENSSSTL